MHRIRGIVSRDCKDLIKIISIFCIFPLPSIVSFHQEALYYACNTERRKTKRRVRKVPQLLSGVGVFDYNKTTGKKKAHPFQYLPCYDLYNAPKHNPRVGEQRRDYLCSAQRYYLAIIPSHNAIPLHQQKLQWCNVHRTLYCSVYTLQYMYIWMR